VTEKAASPLKPGFIPVAGSYYDDGHEYKRSWCQSTGMKPVMDPTERQAHVYPEFIEGTIG
jgi:hypothetical protein